MSTPPPDRSASAARPRRADAERSAAAILEAAIDTLSSDPDVSMAEIARRAGVVRATIYVHFPTRDSLLDAVMDRTIADVTTAVVAAEPQAGEPAEALERVLRTTWRQLDRMHSLIALNAARLSGAEFHRRHSPFIAAIAPLIERGQQAGAFRPDVPAAWHLSMLLGIVHAASGEVRSGRISDDAAEPVLLATARRALAPDS